MKRFTLLIVVASVLITHNYVFTTEHKIKSDGVDLHNIKDSINSRFFKLVKNKTCLFDIEQKWEDLKNQIDSSIKAHKQRYLLIPEYLRDKKNDENFKTFGRKEISKEENNGIDIHSKVEQFIHNMYIDNCKLKYNHTYNKTSNNNFAAYAIVTFSNKNKRITLIISNKEFLQLNMKQSDVLTLECINRDDLISKDYDYLNVVNDINNSFDNFCTALQFGTERDQFIDDELKFLGTLFVKHKEIMKMLSSQDKNFKFTKMNIQIFTFMDMCHYCYTAWNLLYEQLKELYKQYSNNNFDINCCVYSIRPYVNSNSDVLKSFNIMNANNAQDESINPKDWKDTNVKFVRRQKYTTYNALTSNPQIKQYIDIDGVNAFKCDTTNNE